MSSNTKSTPNKSKKGLGRGLGSLLGGGVSLGASSNQGVAQEKPARPQYQSRETSNASAATPQPSSSTTRDSSHLVSSGPANTGLSIGQVSTSSKTGFPTSSFQKKPQTPAHVEIADSSDGEEFEFETIQGKDKLAASSISFKKTEKQATEKSEAPNPESSDEKIRESRIWQIEVDRIYANENQPRKHFDENHIKELSASIKEQGILSPIIVRRRKQGGFEIIAGERRWRASKMAGLEKVPVIFKEVEDKQSLELALIENIQRQDLNPMEEALAYQQLIEEYELTQAEAAKRVGKERATVTNLLRLLTLPNEVAAMISSNLLSMGHAKVLLSMGDPQKQIEVAKKIAGEKLSVRATEGVVKGLAKNSGEEKIPSSAETLKKKLMDNLANDLQRALQTKVKIDYRGSKGKISINFYSNDELNSISEKIKNGCQI